LLRAKTITVPSQRHRCLLLRPCQVCLVVHGSRATVERPQSLVVSQENCGDSCERILRQQLQPLTAGHIQSLLEHMGEDSGVCTLLTKAACQQQKGGRSLYSIVKIQSRVVNTCWGGHSHVDMGTCLFICGVIVVLDFQTLVSQDVTTCSETRCQHQGQS